MDYSLTELLSALSSAPDLALNWTLDDLWKYVSLARHIRPDIEALLRTDQAGPPERLSFEIHNFLKLSMGLKDEMAKQAWGILKGIIWNDPALHNSIKSCSTHLDGLFPRDRSGRSTSLARVCGYLKDFVDFGIPYGIGVFNLYPPTRSCINPDCRYTSKFSDHIGPDRQLVEPKIYKATLFTRDHGSLPIHIISYYCRSCHTRYYPNYFVHTNASIRTYYAADVIDLIEVSKHVYMERGLCEQTAVMMATAWTSATNCARIYNSGNPNASLLPTGWSKAFTLTVEDVWNGFYIHCLLQNAERYRYFLEVPHRVSNFDRINSALYKANILRVGHSQPHWNHICDKCCWIDQSNGDGFNPLRSVVVDGITIGHPCCGVHDCTIPLESGCNRFCRNHQEYERKCCVVDCNSPVESGFKTCADAGHRNYVSGN